MKKNRIEQAITSAIFAITIVILSIFTFTAYKPSESQVSNQSLFSDSDVSSTATVDKISNTKSYPIPGEVSNSNLAPEQLPTPTADPPKPSDPYAVVLIPEVVAVDPVDATKASSHIVYGKVIEVLAPRWSTPDGKRPDNPFEQQFAIFTPIRIAVIETLKGAKQENVTIYIPGGKIGQDSTEIEPLERYFFAKDEQVLLFLVQGVEVFQGSSTDFYDRYNVSSDGIAKNIYRTIPIEQLLGIVRETVATLPAK